MRSLMKGRSQFRYLTNTADIPGAQTSTLKKGIQTIRHTNPLMPKYQNPGHIHDSDGYDHLKSKTHSGGFVKKPLAVSEKPKTPTAASNKDNIGSPIDIRLPDNQQPLFESYVPAVAASRDEISAPIIQPPTPNKVKTPQQSVLPSVAKKPISTAGSVEEGKPLHKRIDRDEYIKDVHSFYGAHNHSEAPSKISRLIEELDNQKKVMEKLDRKQKDILVNSKLENRKTAAQMIDKFIQTA
jgi:hypothetical protein